MSQAACHTCGNYISDTARFCPRCGSTIGWEPPSAIEPPSGNQPPARPNAYQQPYYQQPGYQPLAYPQPYSAQPYPPHAYGAAPAMAPLHVERKDKTAAILLALFLGFWTWLYTYKRDGWKFWLNLVLQLTIFNPLWTWILLFLPNIGLYIWAIIDVAVKPQQFYDNYPHG